MTRNISLRVLAMVGVTLLFSVVVGDPVGTGGDFVVWILATVLLGHLLVALCGTDARHRRYPSGGDL
jgi:hypothetical protein